ncbi:outer membrane protein assembly factor BamD [Actinobacillus porcinus]|uniref:outer membrane protein assembly factor BamD n=1 Tax=Actinobacillus porcinus TaxID=51048 RepID=UPI002357C9DC|nr:outer membrane protein assembly factor BamD [Actinobacillus porcinus]
MRKLKSLAFATLTALAMTACSSSKEVEQASEQELFTIGQAHLQNAEYSDATRYLQAVDTRFPGGTYSEQAQLNLIYVAYKTQDYTTALVTADRFLQQHSGSPYTDYVLYMAALTNMSMGDNYLQDLFGIDRSTRETTSMKTAFSNFQTLVQHFPSSQYTPDALTRMAYIKDRLARHELEIAKFYAKRKAWVAVSNRVTDMLRLYPDTYATLEALPLMQEAYHEMGLTQLEQKAAALVKANEGKVLKEAEKPDEPFLSLPSWLKFGDSESEKAAE